MHSVPALGSIQVFDEQSTPPHHFCIRLHIVVPLASVVSCWMPSIAAEQLHENISNITEIEKMVTLNVFFVSTCCHRYSNLAHAIAQPLKILIFLCCEVLYC